MELTSKQLRLAADSCKIWKEMEFENCSGLWGKEISGDRYYGWPAVCVSVGSVEPYSFDISAHPFNEKEGFLYRETALAKLNDVWIKSSEWNDVVLDKVQDLIYDNEGDLDYAFQGILEGQEYTQAMDMGFHDEVAQAWNKAADRLDQEG